MLSETESAQTFRSQRQKVNGEKPTDATEEPANQQPESPPSVSLQLIFMQNTHSAHRHTHTLTPPRRCDRLHFPATLGCSVCSPGSEEEREKEERIHRKNTHTRTQTLTVVVIVGWFTCTRRFSSTMDTSALFDSVAIPLRPESQFCFDSHFSLQSWL